MTNEVTVTLTRSGTSYELADGEGFVFARLEEPNNNEHVREWLDEALADLSDELLAGMLDGDQAGGEAL
ncbi:MULTISPECIES: hypothetical protein [Nocardia]|uniref:hypothetical protein n=1 Tax=Nocardia TaxID=1817 RepID=UPI0024564DEB|nr:MULTISPECIES: hypothetical protein [Nocardia]